MNMIIFLTLIFLGMCIGFSLSNLLRGKKIKTERTAEPQNTDTPLRPIQYKKPDPEQENLREKKLMLEDAIAIIQKLSQTIATTLDLNELAEEIVTTTTKILNVEICALLLLDENTETLSIAASRGISDELVGQICIKKGQEISGVVAKLNDLKIINDLKEVKQLYNLKHDNCYRNTLVSVPLAFKNTVLGVLNISNKRSGNPFSAIDIEIIKIISFESASVLQNFNFFQEQQKNYLNTIIALANAIDARDPYTYQHSNNVARYAVRLAKEMKLSTQIIEDIRYAALLHDIGKIGIKDEILMKAGSLTDEEYLQIQKHTVKGEEIIRSLPFLQRISGIIRHHHERIDGKGYPDKIKGEDIELGAKILMLADTFDAMTTNRAYRNSLSFEKAKNELIKNKGSQLDSILVDRFLEILKTDPQLFLEPESPTSTSTTALP